MGWLDLASVPPLWFLTRGRLEISGNFWFLTKVRCPWHLVHRRPKGWLSILGIIRCQETALWTRTNPLKARGAEAENLGEEMVRPSCPTLLIILLLLLL